MEPAEGSTDEQLTFETAREMFPRFLSAVTGMAVARGGVNARLALVVDQVVVFDPAEFPPPSRGLVAELHALLKTKAVPLSTGRCLRSTSFPRMSK